MITHFSDLFVFAFLIVAACLVLVILISGSSKCLVALLMEEAGALGQCLESRKQKVSSAQVYLHELCRETKFNQETNINLPWVPTSRGIGQLRGAQ